MISTEQSSSVRQKAPRIALLTPYTGGNFGDAAIQDAIITNIRLRLPQVQISGVSLNCENFLRRHDVIDTFPLLAHIRGCGILQPGFVHQTPRERDINRGNKWRSKVKMALSVLPLVWKFSSVLVRCAREFRHSFEGFKFIRTHDLVVVSGGGQLDEVYEGAWRHPFGLFKWAVLARLARVPYVVVSVGAGKVTSTSSRLLLAGALRTAEYRSYRDENSKRVVVDRLLGRAASDPVVPDLAFSLPISRAPSPASIQAMAGSRAVIAISPIAIGKPGRWPTENLPLYDRYLHEMAKIVSELLGRRSFLVLVTSCLDEDQEVIPELLSLLDGETRQTLADQIYIPAIATWQEFVAVLEPVDLLIASRLHSTILGFITETATVAISSGAKVDAVMSDLGQAEYLLQIRDFTSAKVLEAQPSRAPQGCCLTGDCRIPTSDGSRFRTAV